MLSKCTVSRLFKQPALKNHDAFWTCTCICLVASRPKCVSLFVHSCYQSHKMYLLNMYTKCWLCTQIADGGKRNMEFLFSPPVFCYFHLLYFVCLRLAHGKHECCMLPTVGLLGVLLAPSLLCFLALVFLLFTGLHDAATRAWVSVPFSFFLVFLVSDRKLCASKLMLNRHSH